MFQPKSGVTRWVCEGFTLLFFCSHLIFVTPNIPFACSSPFRQSEEIEMRSITNLRVNLKKWWQTKFPDGFWSRYWPVAFVVLCISCLRFIPFTNFMDLNKGLPSDFIMLKIDSMQANLSQAHEHNLQTISGLYTSMSISSTLRSTERGNRMQARVFYSAILAVLVAMLLSEKRPDEPRGLWPRTSMFVLLIATLMMYGLDVQTVDFENRADLSDKARGVTATKIADLSPTDSTWYVVDNSCMKGFADHADSTHVWRKVKMARAPNAEQIMYYFVPFLLTIWWWRKELPKR